MLKKLLMVGLGLVLTLLTLTLVVVLGTVTHADAVRHSNSSWIDATKVTDPLPGQLYAITGDGVIEAQLCPLTREDFSISTDALSGRIFVNHLGEAVPAVIWIARTWFQVEEDAEDVLDLDYRLEWPGLRREFAPLSSLTQGVKRILQPREMTQIERHVPAAQVTDVRRLEGCADAILQTLRGGWEVCQLTEVIKEQAGKILAVRFATHCLTQDRPRRLPELRVDSFWTSIKLGLGLVDQQLAPTVLVDAAAG